MEQEDTSNPLKKYREILIISVIISLVVLLISMPSPDYPPTIQTKFCNGYEQTELIGIHGTARYFCNEEEFVCTKERCFYLKEKLNGGD